MVRQYKLTPQAQDKLKFAMTDSMLISRAEFMSRFGIIFDKLYNFNEEGECVIKAHENSEYMEFCSMPLSGWLADSKTFQCFLDFISTVVTPKCFIFVEVGTLTRFTEARVVRANQIEIEKMLYRSLLPHFDTACFDESARWCALFDNNRDKVVICRVNRCNASMKSDLVL